MNTTLVSDKSSTTEKFNLAFSDIAECLHRYGDLIGSSAKSADQKENKRKAEMATEMLFDSIRNCGGDSEMQRILYATLTAEFSRFGLGEPDVVRLMNWLFAGFVGVGVEQLRKKGYDTNSAVQNTFQQLPIAEWRNVLKACGR